MMVRATALMRGGQYFYRPYTILLVTYVHWRLTCPDWQRYSSVGDALV